MGSGKWPRCMGRRKDEKGLIRRLNANHNINRYSVLDTARESREVRHKFPSVDIGFS